MMRMIGRRLLIAIPVLFGITVLNFALIHMAPGNPVEMYINPSMTQQDIELRKEQLGINDPLPVQYVRWLGQLLKGDLGYSYATYQPVGEMLSGRIGPTLLLMGTALVIAYLFAIPVGIWSARKAYSWFDYSATGFAFLGISIPNFFLGLGAIYIFAIQLKWLPTGGMYTLGKQGDWTDVAMHLILPACVLATGIAGNMVRYVRSSVMDVLGQEYLRTARAKGMSEFIVINKHALKNALIPIITVIGLDIPLLLGGAVITEQIFQWPGMGQLLMQSISSRDYPTLMAINLLAAVTVLAANLVTDIAYRFVDPTMRD